MADEPPSPPWDVEQISSEDARSVLARLIDDSKALRQTDAERAVEPPLDSYIEYGIRYVVDGTEYTSTTTSRSLVDAHKQIIKMMRHQQRNNAKAVATGYRVVRRTVTVTPWELADE